MSSIKTTKVTGRRTLHFDSLSDIVNDVERLANAKEIKTLGNWTPGQVFKHLAIVMHGAIDGIDIQLPLHMRLIMPILVLTMKSRFLNKPMPPGFTLNAAAAKVLMPSATSLEDGLAAIRTGLQRLINDQKRVPHPFIGKLSIEDWNKLQCRHSELHLSFLIPVE